MSARRPSRPPADPISRALGAFGTRAAALDFGFFKVNVPGTGFALLVDFIVRREAGLVQVRASLHGPSHAGVYRSEMPIAAAKIQPPGRSAVLASAGPCWLGARASLGTVGPISWELRFEPAGPAFFPLPPILGPLRPVDMFLASAPQVRFSGEVSVAGTPQRLADAPGMVSSYHGRALPSRWTWISCNAFDDPGVAVEAMVAPTRLFGLGGPLETGYFHLRAGGRAETIVSPLTGRVALTRSDDGLEVVARRRGGREHRLVCSAPAAAYHDLGEGIRNTLLGDCALLGVGRAVGTAGLEERVASLAQVHLPG